MTTAIKLPPIAKISMIGIWIETVLYGINCVMYGLCMFILLRGGKTATLRWILVVVSSVIFVLCTVHIGASLRQLLDAFIYAPADVPNYSTMYWLDLPNPLRMLKDTLYVILVLIHYLILIWRLYMIFMRNWRVIIFPIILAAGFAFSASASLFVSASSYNGLFGSVPIPLIIIVFAFGATLNVSITGGIVMRLWRVGRTIASLTATSTNRFASLIYIIIESGAIATACGVVVFALFVSHSPFAFAALDVVVQLVVLIQLLIVVQVEIGRTRSTNVDSLKTIHPAQGGIRFRAGIPRGQDSQDDTLLDITLSRSSSSAHFAA